MTTDSTPERLADQAGRPAGVKRTSDCFMLVALGLGSLSHVMPMRCSLSALSNDSDVNRAPELLYSLPDCMRSRYRCSEVFLGYRARV
jgi:hypothetical protein